MGIIHFRALIAGLLLLLCSACDQDPFHRGERTIIGRYKLKQWEDSSTYNLMDGKHDEGGGAIDGTVLRIGWNGCYILVQRQATFAGDGNGWLIIDTTSDRMYGPFQTSELYQHREVANIKTVSAFDAWRELK